MVSDSELVAETPDSLELSAMLRVCGGALLRVGGPQVRGYGEWPNSSEAWLRERGKKVI